MAYVSFIDGKVVDVPKAEKPASKTRSLALGCESCPLNRRYVPGTNGTVPLNKIKGVSRVTGKSVFIWAIAPGGVENARELELVGPSGQFLWQKLKAVGITREMCDIQNVVRCWPTTRNEQGRIIDRQPTKDELRCCSKYTSIALAKNARAAKVYLVFGQVAAKQLLGREYKKDVPTFWSEKFNANVFVMEHPSFFIRGGSRERLKNWEHRLQHAADIVKADKGFKYSYVYSQDYTTIKDQVSARSAANEIIDYALKHRTPVSVDIEYGWVSSKTRKPCAPGKGKKVILVVGLSHRPRTSRMFVIDHPTKVPITLRNRKGILRSLQRVLSNGRIQKVMHHGTADEIPIRELLGIRVKGYTFDTNYSTYLKWPQQKAYGLDAHSAQRVPEFSGYKDIVHEYVGNPPNYARIPLRIMRIYNGGDCDLTTRLHRMTKEWDGPLLRVYIDAAYVLDEMQKRGPRFDKKYYNDVVKLVPKRLAKVRDRLLLLAGDPEINLNAPAQVSKILYDKLKFEPVKDQGARSTAAEVLRIMAQDKRRGEFPKLLTEYRELSRMEKTYIKNYLQSAEINNGELRTLWWITGTITGRLRSGGKGVGREAAATGIVNFQNLHGEVMLQNLLISDHNWRRSLVNIREAWEDRERREQLKNLVLFLAFDYAQIEIRMAAEMSEDPNLLAAVMSGDIHTAVGHDLTGWDKEKIKNDKETRTLIKNLHFGILYGMSPKSLYQFLTGLGIKISQQRCDEYVNRYFRKYRRVRELIEDLRSTAERLDYVETLFGFRRPIIRHGADAMSDDEGDGRKTFWGNQAINSPIQGSAHQLMLFAMAILKRQAKSYQYLQTPVMEVHDALDFYVTVRELKEAAKEGVQLLTKAVPRFVEENFKRRLKVPLESEAKAGFRLGALALYNDERPEEFLIKWKKYNKKVEESVTEKWGIAA